MRKFITVWPFFVIPAISLALAISLRIAAGPFWLSTNSDPAYLYLINSLYMVKGVAPYFVDHPGTMLQVLFLFLFKIINLGHDAPTTIEAVLKAPELYLHVMHAMLIGLFAITQVWLAVYAFRKTHSQIAGLLTQVPVFFYFVLPSYNSPEPILPVIANINAEPLLISIMNVFAIIILKLLYAKDDRERRVSAALLGVVCALALVTKLTAVLIAMLPLFLLKGWRARLIYIICLLGTCIVATSPIWPRYPQFFAWVGGLWSYAGAHGTGKKIFLDVGKYLHSLIIFIKCFWPYFIFLIVVIVCLVRQCVSKKRQEARGILVLTVAALVQFVLVAKQPVIHYILPSLALCGLILSLLCSAEFSGLLRRPQLWRILLITIVVVGIVSALSYRNRLAKLTGEIQNFYQTTRQAYPGCAIASYYRSSGPLYALHFGDNIYNTRELGAALNRLYPGQVFFQRWNYQLNDFENVVRVSQVQKKTSCILFEGPAYDFSSGPYEVELVKKGRVENLYRLKASQEEKAVVCYLKALRLKERGEYQPAYLYALQSKILKFQPEPLLTGLMNEIQEQIK